AVPVPPHEVEVGVAHAGGRNADQRLVRARDRVGQLRDPEAILLEPCCPHLPSPVWRTTQVLASAERLSRRQRAGPLVASRADWHMLPPLGRDLRRLPHRSAGGVPARTRLVPPSPRGHSVRAAGIRTIATVGLALTLTLGGAGAVVASTASAAFAT